MIKDVIISALAAALLMDRLAGAGGVSGELWICLWITGTVILIIFCLFLEEQVEKYRKRRERVRRLSLILAQLSGKERK